VRHEHGGTFDLFLRDQGAIIDYWDSPEDPNRHIDVSAYSGFILLGGPMGAYEADKHTFLAKEYALIKQLLRLNKPLVGFCLGAQMIAKALNANVYPGERLKEIGWYPVRFTDAALQDSCMYPNVSAADAAEQTGLNLFQWHGDTFDLPVSAIRLLTSTLYENQAFRFGTNVYAFQCHFEVTSDMVEDWLAKGAKELESVSDYIDPKVILSDTALNIEPMAEWATHFYMQFWSLILNNCGVSQDAR